MANEWEGKLNFCNHQAQDQASAKVFLPDLRSSCGVDAHWEGSQTQVLGSTAALLSVMQVCLVLVHRLKTNKGQLGSYWPK